jgi:hypothetical protein
MNLADGSNLTAGQDRALTIFVVVMLVAAVIYVLTHKGDDD